MAGSLGKAGNPEVGRAGRCCRGPGQKDEGYTKAAASQQQDEGGWVTEARRPCASGED